MLPLMATSDMPYEFIKNEYYPIDYIKRALVAGIVFEMYEELWMKKP